MSLSNAQIEKILMDELRLYHHPIAVNFFYDDVSLTTFKEKIDYVTPIKPLTFCQWEIAARMQNKTVLCEAQDDLGCSNAWYSFGWKDLDENEIKSHKKYTKNPEQAKRFIASKQQLPKGLKAISVGPLGRAVLPPDVVHFYCDNMQSYHLACDYMAAMDEHPLRPAVTMNSAACGGAAYCFNENTFNMCPACSGSYNAGKTERGELNVFIPGKAIERVVERLLERINDLGSSAITRPGDSFPGGDICKNCPIIIFKPGK